MPCAERSRVLKKRSFSPAAVKWDVAHVCCEDPECPNNIAAIRDQLLRSTRAQHGARILGSAAGGQAWAAAAAVCDRLGISNEQLPAVCAAAAAQAPAAAAAAAAQVAAALALERGDEEVLVVESREPEGDLGWRQLDHHQRQLALPFARRLSYPHCLRGLPCGPRLIDSSDAAWERHRQFTTDPDPPLRPDKLVRPLPYPHCLRGLSEVTEAD